MVIKRLTDLTIEELKRNIELYKNSPKCVKYRDRLYELQNLETNKTNRELLQKRHLQKQQMQKQQKMIDDKLFVLTEKIIFKKCDMCDNDICYTTIKHGKCCSCKDERPIVESGYCKYVDGVGETFDGTRNEYYCPNCKKIE